MDSKGATWSLKENMYIVRNNQGVGGFNFEGSIWQTSTMVYFAANRRVYIWADDNQWYYYDDDSALLMPAMFSPIEDPSDFELTDYAQRVFATNTQLALEDGLENMWSFSANSTSGSNRLVLRNGSGASNFYCVEVNIIMGEAFGRKSDNTWYRWTGNSWSLISSPFDYQAN